MPRTNRRNPNQRRRARAAIEGLECRTLLATFAPNSFLDEIDLTPGNGVVDTTSGNITLRAAIMEANALAGEDTITLGAGTYEMSIAGGFEDAGLTGDMDIFDDLIIQGAGAATTTVDGNLVDRIFHVWFGAKVRMSGITVTGGFARGESNSLLGWSGGGIVNNATLDLVDCVITGNSSTEPNDKSGDGGGILNLGGTLTLLRVTISNNECEDTGGGIRSHGEGTTATIIDSIVSGNIGFSGGGLSNTDGSKMTVINSTISGNEAYNNLGGGIRSFNAMTTVSRSTVSGNTANVGGGLANAGGGTLVVLDSTVSGNHADAMGGTGGGGIYTNGGSVTIRRATISGNESANEGGGVRSNGGTAETTISESTIFNNTARTLGGGVANVGQSTMTVTNTTISGNRATGAGGIFNGATGNEISVKNSTLAENIRNKDTTPAPGDIDNITGGTFNIQNSIVASGMGYSGGASVVDSLGNNIFVNSTAFGSGFHASDQLGVNPLLGPLASNGGPTQTYALLPGSPAINAANTAAAPAIDQRGAPRPTGPQADIGAYEVDGVQPSIVGSSFAFETGHSFTIQFSENVSEALVIGDLLIRPVLAGGTLGSGITIQSYSYDVDTQTGTFVLPLLADGNYRATLNAGDVADISGNLLTTGLSADFFVLAGDANRDRSVNLHDLMALAANWMGTGKTFSQADFDYDGDVDAHDVGILASKWQQKLDAPLPSAPVNTAPATRAAARKPSRMVDQVGLTS